MSRIIIISNRLPLQIVLDGDKPVIRPSVGGLATGMKSVHRSGDSLWIGWTGLAEEEIPSTFRQEINLAVEKENCVAVPLNREEVEQFYYGFSNETLWPLFHYFTEYARFSRSAWEAYVEVNRRFAEVAAAYIRKGDRVWIHDYQLLLLPGMIRELIPDASIGFFLHIPFPSYEVFRILPWRKEILNGMLGADLLGFHTYDYERHLLSSVRRLLGHDVHFNEIILRDRIVIADNFPMGIDYERFRVAALQHHKRPEEDRSEIRQSLDQHLRLSPEVKLVLSIDRLDYTKGIVSRLLAFEYFLKKNREYIGRVSLVMLTVPSRSSVEQYQIMKSEVDQQVGRINGELSTIAWTPVWYFYRSLPFQNLIDLYCSCDVALLTPLRDGMNLVAKEYLACRVKQTGVLILSEMAGAAKELSEALVINPNDYEEIAAALKQALSMPEEEQISRNTVLQDRLKRYNIEKWAGDFVSVLEKSAVKQERYRTKLMTSEIRKQIQNAYERSERRILFLDYDGTLTGFKSKPELAVPDDDLYHLLDRLAADPRNEVVLISGRDRVTFDRWFGDRKYTRIVEHGVWSSSPGEAWQLIEEMAVDWKSFVRPAMEFFVDRTPGTFIEEKSYSLVWHYRKADPELGNMRANEMKDELRSLIANHQLEIMEGHKVIEVKNSGINKGRAARQWMSGKAFDFILGIGDDWTDEYLFSALPSGAFTIKVGVSNTLARYNVESQADVRAFLDWLSST